MKHGKKWRRCIELLEELGIQVQYCYPNRGYWSHAQQDVYRWEWGGEFQGKTVCGGCWESMTDCAKPGMRLEWDRQEDEVRPVKREDGNFSR